MSLPSPRTLAPLGLLAIVPAAVYFLASGEPATRLATGLSAVSVLLVVASLVVVFSPAEATDGSPTP